ncbi:MAG: TonB family protein [Sterolibacteriaceae bacterium]|jgi:protein TonB|nr:TonB family protein [Sterolibacteriaceae bacterium]MBK9086705.1 TonB family protein [Sterolibacteriaceae bacterium]
MSKPAQAAKPIVTPARAAESSPVKPARSAGQHAAARPAKAGPRAARPKARSSIPRPVRGGALANPDNRMQLAIGLSVLVHLIALSLHFKFPDASLFRHKESQLEVVLVNSKSATRPDKPQARAQSNLDGGGITDEDRRAKTPLPASQQKREGDALVEAQRRVEQLEAMQQRLMTQVKSKAAVVAEQYRTSEQPEAPAPVSGRDLADRALAVAKLEAQIDKELEEYQKRPRKKFIGARTSEYIPAQYIEAWRQKIERIGTLNYPEAARGRHYGSLLLYIEIKADGDINRVEIQRSSGNKILDDAAMRIVRLASPFAAFPPEMHQKFDILAFARTWTFTNSDSLATSADRD